MRSSSKLTNGVMPSSFIGGGRTIRWRRPCLIVTCIIILIYFFILATSDGFGNGGESHQTVEERLALVSREVRLLRDQSNRIMFIAKQIREMRASKDDPNVDVHLSMAKLQSRLSNAAAQLAAIQSDNDNLKTVSGGNNPSKSLHHEYLRRRSEMRVRELGFLVDEEINALLHTASKANVQRLRLFQRRVEDQRFLLQDDLSQLSRVDGGYKWRLSELRRLGSIVQERIRRLQNPPDCLAAHKLVCNLNKGCGFGCQAHHVLYCLILAYSTGRTLILESVGWRYSHMGWSAVFEPLSHNCTSRESRNKKTLQWGAHDYQSAGVVEVPIVDALRGRPPFLPQAIPSDLEKALTHLHGAPFVWFSGQLLKYVMRPNADMASQIKQAKKELQFQNPIVGIHIRRTDKVGTEAAFHAADEYMTHVESWYRHYELTHGPPSDDGWRKRVFLATDDHRVLAEIRTKYSDYIVVTDNEISKTAVLSSRYSTRALRGVVLDMVLLADCDFLVCTFSSQVCRVSYELMQTLHADASTAFRSLDDIYYYGGQNANHVRALMDHTPLHHDEIALKRGDLIRIAGNHWNGLSKGTNTRTGQTGLFPSYKTEFVITSARMGDYAEVRLKT